MNKNINRRNFIKTTGIAAMSTGLAASGCSTNIKEKGPLFKISLAEWSVHNAIFGDSIQKNGWEKWGQLLRTDFSACVTGPLDHLDFPVIARTEFDIDGIEHVNTCFFNKAKNPSYLAELKKICDDNGVTSLLIMCDNEGQLGAPDGADRKQAIENHYKWVEAAKFLGCHSIRVNAASSGSFEEQQKLAADGLHRLGEFGEQGGINIIVENHGGLSSNGLWLAGVMKLADHPRVGTLPDFGNFRVNEGPEEWYDRYKGVQELMPFAKAVSAKSQDFDENGNETKTDYEKMMRIVLDAGYRGYVGIEYEGSVLSEYDGIRATKTLLEKVRETLASDYA